MFLGDPGTKIVLTFRRIRQNSRLKQKKKTCIFMYPGMIYIYIYILNALSPRDGFILRIRLVTLRSVRASRVSIFNEICVRRCQRDRLCCIGWPRVLFNAS